MATYKGRHLIDIRGPNGEKKPHVMGVFRILDRHPDGTPKTLQNILMSEKVDLRVSKEFMTAYYPLIMQGNEGQG